ncbi:SDR family NAD(P)-dependent oxidoreductase [Congregibacter brevis]|uniref:SDR family NAD(P)-dependent oxidoreductase n=1 Tax=Congregibacter brevis TaxID=3081201 RepID=A0ABZ0IBM1_9GAMM|nr:SDR family NAD(P)-dependent oxidoreductase [Congregibacter sp. IMCC45268]
MNEWRKAGNTAVITGGTSGLGLETARRYTLAGMNLVLVDRNADSLEAARAELEAIGQGADIVTEACDVSDLTSMQALSERTFERFGTVNCLMNNAGMGLPVGMPWENYEELTKTLATNLFGVVHGCQAFIPQMLESSATGVIINTGSKQGLTRPPGNYAYNLSKVGVLAYTESVAHAFTQIEGCALSAHLLIPGFVFTPMISRFIPQKPDFAWTAEETVDFMLPCIDRGDFYVICPDNESPRSVDEKRLQWSADDLIKNRPPLSRWHTEYREAFDAFMKD